MQGRGQGANAGPGDVKVAVPEPSGKRGLSFSLLLKLAIPVVIVMVLLQFMDLFGYFWHEIGSNEVGVRFEANRPVDIVGPGMWSDWSPLNLGRFRSITAVKVEAMDFEMSDPEVLTQDKQRISVVVRGRVTRPGYPGSESTLLENWGKYKTIYLDDTRLVGTLVQQKDQNPVYQGGLMTSLGQQAAKVCVGDRTFDKAVIGTARDDLRVCIDKELSVLAGEFGLAVTNVVVPNVGMAPEVQKRLDEITQARLMTEKAVQESLQKEAEAKKNLAEQQGLILVEQGRIQEKAKQDALTADLQRKATESQRAVIEAEKSNALLAAQKDQAIAEVQRQIALVRAEADMAPEIAKAKAYEANPGYLELKRVEAMSAALKATDKILVVPEGTNPVTVLSGQTPQLIVPAQTTTGR
jgi:regulator of protease activity HflC (stomatin/prohibitin superfamily)